MNIQTKDQLANLIETASLYGQNREAVLPIAAIVPAYFRLDYPSDLGEYSSDWERNKLLTPSNEPVRESEMSLGTLVMSLIPNGSFILDRKEVILPFLVDGDSRFQDWISHYEKQGLFYDFFDQQNPGGYKHAHVEVAKKIKDLQARFEKRSPIQKMWDYSKRTDNALRMILNEIIDSKVVILPENLDEILNGISKN